jgi:hypothetical protein
MAQQGKAPANCRQDSVQLDLRKDAQPMAKRKFTRNIVKNPCQCCACKRKSEIIFYRSSEKGSTEVYVKLPRNWTFAANASAAINKVFPAAARVPLEHVIGPEVYELMRCGRCTKLFVKAILS